MNTNLTSFVNYSLGVSSNYSLFLLSSCWLFITHDRFRVQRVALVKSGFIYNTFGNIFEGGLIARGGLFNLAKCINGSKVSRGRTCGYRALYCFF